MKLLTLFVLLLVCLSSLLAAIIASFSPKKFASLTPQFYQSGLKRFAQASGFWLVFIASIAGTLVPFLVFFVACITLASSIPLFLKAGNVRASRLWVLPSVLVIGSLLAAIFQPLGLKVLALPKADELSFTSIPWRIVKTYEEGLWFEGIAAGENGILYLSGNRGLDFSRGDYYHDAEGELIALMPNGNEHILFKTPKGLTAGVPVVAPDNSLYLTSHGNTSHIWHIDTSGKARQLAQLPNNAWPNGLDLGPDGMLYTPDSKLGLIWRVNTTSGKVEVALRDPALKARPFISLAPGANGLHFKGRDLLVTVSDRTTVLKYSMDEKGRFGMGTIIASGIPGDDFAMGQDGSLFITTHPYNTLVRVSPEGKRSVIAMQEQHIVGATDAVFGKTDQDRSTLYVVTDGGAFTGGPKTRGELIALEPYAKQ